ncbi:MAG: hypothetical protein H0V81_17895 [Solirubrobacterales bacterium]|nr:hypothetical protein [Solirubrobacterales bacterium]
MSRKLLRAVSLALVFALGVVAVPLALAATGPKSSGAPSAKTSSAKAKRAKAKRKVQTFRTVQSGAPRLLPNIRRACGSSRSSTKLRSRTRKQVRAATIRYTYRYCSGRRVIREITTRTITRTKTEVKTQVIAIPGPVTTTPGPVQVVTTPAPPAQVVTTPAPPAQTTTVTTTAPAPPPPAPRGFKLTLLHNNDGESKYATGDSVANYGGVARFKTVVDRLRAEADAVPAVTDQDKGTLVVSSGDNFLAGSGFTASLRRNQATGAPYYDSLALTAIGYDAATLGNHEYDFGPDVLSTFIEGTDGTFPFLAANVDTSGEPALQALRARAGSPTLR